MAGFCRIWILIFGLIAKPLYGATKGPDSEPLDWNQGLQRAFQALKQAFGFPNLEKLFTLYAAERQEIFLGVFT